MQLLLGLGWLDDALYGAAAKLIDNSLGGDQLESVLKVVGFTQGITGINFSLFWDVINKGLSFVTPFGYALITTYFLMYLFDAASKDQVTVDSVIKVLIQLVMVVAVMGNLALIINAFLSIAESLLASVSGFSDPTASISVSGTTIVNQWRSTGEDTALTILIQSLGIWLIHQIAIIAIDFAGIARLLEVGWRIVFAPVGVANCFEGGANSAGVKYLKSLLGACLSGVAIYIVAAAGFAITASFLTSPTGAAMWLADAAFLGTAGAAIGISNKIREVIA